MQIISKISDMDDEGFYSVTLLDISDGSTEDTSIRKGEYLDYMKKLTSQVKTLLDQGADKSILFALLNEVEITAYDDGYKNGYG